MCTMGWRFINLYKNNEMRQAYIKTQYLYYDVGNESFQLCIPDEFHAY